MKYVTDKLANELEHVEVTVLKDGTTLWDVPDGTAWAMTQATLEFVIHHVERCWLKNARHTFQELQDTVSVTRPLFDRVGKAKGGAK